MNEMRKLMEAVQLDEKASSEQWEIAINNLIADGDKQFSAGSGKGVWEWVRNELHGMLDFQPDEDDGGMGHENALGNDHNPSYQNFPG